MRTDDAYALDWFAICDAAEKIDRDWMFRGNVGADAIIAILDQVEIAPFELGVTYKTVSGEDVVFVIVHREGTSYETMECANGINRYTRRDFGRVTGSPFDHSDPRCVLPKYRIKESS